jgi:hypothetical protein
MPKIGPSILRINVYGGRNRGFLFLHSLAYKGNKDSDVA